MKKLFLLITSFLLLMQSTAAQADSTFKMFSNDTNKIYFQVESDGDYMLISECYNDSNCDELGLISIKDASQYSYDIEKDMRSKLGKHITLSGVASIFLIVVAAASDNAGLGLMGMFAGGYSLLCMGAKPVNTGMSAIVNNLNGECKDLQINESHDELRKRINLAIKELGQ